MKNQLPARKPQWLKVQSNTGKQNEEVMRLLRTLNLHTVCEEAECPNCGECFKKQTATFMILGKNCTRRCTFCTVAKGCPTPIDVNEPGNIAQAVKILGLRHVVITSVTRDDLPDGGAAHFANVIRAIRTQCNSTPVVEVLIPDFKGDETALATVLRAYPDILNHNVETVPALYSEVRPQAIYQRSLTLLRRVHVYSPGITTKSGMMLGLGETKEQVLGTLQDLRSAGCDVLTLGQYLAPSKQHHPVIEYISPAVFAEYKKAALKMGFSFVASGPLVRSSYVAEDAYNEMLLRRRAQASGGI